MNSIIKIIGIAGFFLCLLTMYLPGHGIQKIGDHDPGFRLLDMQLRYDSIRVHETMKGLGEEGRKAYRDYLMLDFLFIGCFLVVMLTITNSLFATSALIKIVSCAGILRALFDIVENIMLLLLISNFPIYKHALSIAASRATTLKFLMLYLWLAVVLCRLIAAGITCVLNIM